MWGFIEWLGLRDGDELQALLAMIGILGAGVAFLVGFQQYRTAQKWKVKEFVAAEMKEFFGDWRVRNALLMIDWGSRRLRLEAPEEGLTQEPERVTRRIQIRALRPHLLRGDGVTASDADCGEKGGAGFLPIEEQIRDTYDRLLDSFERFAGFVESGLVPATELRPYLGYWIDEIASMEGSEDDLQWTLSLLSYIEFYRFAGATQLFRELGHDISVGGPIWSSLVRRVEQKELSKQLEAVIRGRGRQNLDGHPVPGTA